MSSGDPRDHRYTDQHHQQNAAQQHQSPQYRPQAQADGYGQPLYAHSQPGHYNHQYQQQQPQPQPQLQPQQQHPNQQYYAQDSSKPGNGPVPYYGQQQSGVSFYPSSFGSHTASSSLHVQRPTGSPSLSVYNSVMDSQSHPISYLAAFGTGGLADEPPLFEELGINWAHIRMKTVSVLNPVQQIDRVVMEDTDLAGPLLFCLLFGMSLLLAGKVQFGYIYGVALMGWASIYGILNAMSEHGIDTLRTASVLGYCLLPMLLLSLLSLILPLQGWLGLLVGGLIVLWCTISSSNMFVTALGMRDQRILVAYPVGLFYFCFALMTIF